VPSILVRGANHTFTPLWCREQLSTIVLRWAEQVLTSQLTVQRAAAP
jgi:hypothetical protein